jgi:hypothetical protein
MGKTVLSKTISEGNKQLDLSGFAKGIYFIRAREVGVAALKIIVQ